MLNGKDGNVRVALRNSFKAAGCVLTAEEQRKGWYTGRATYPAQHHPKAGLVWDVTEERA